MIWWNLVYMGKIYKGMQDPVKLLDGLSQFLKETNYDRSILSVDFYGNEYPLTWLQKEIDKYRLTDIVHQHGSVPHGQAVEIEQNARWLWVMGWEDIKERGVVPGKFFEYNGAGRPILITGGFENAEVVKLLREAHIGVWCPDAESIKRVLYDII